MFSAAEKTNHSTTAVQQKAQQQTFFRKAGVESFFGSKEQPAFFNAPVQAKLSVSSPDDPQEKEADAVADKVMRMAEPTVAPVANKEEEKLQKKEDEKKEEAVPVKAKLCSPPVNIQAKCDSCEKEEKLHAKLDDSIQRKEEKEDEQVSPKLFRKIERSIDANGTSLPGSEGAAAGTGTSIDRISISLHHSDIIQRSGRGPPATSIPFEHSLSSSKGNGSVLPGNTRKFMESRFQSDFSGVKVHTGATAESMNKQINAQAFTHGNDIYFNSGKYSPDTADGGALLAHELSHTIQQGASKQNPVKDKTEPTGDKKATEPQKAAKSQKTTEPQKVTEPQKASSNNSANNIEPIAGESKKATGNGDLKTGKSPGVKVTGKKAKVLGSGGAGQLTATEEPAPAKASTSKKKGAAKLELRMPEPPAALNPASQKRLTQAQGRATQSATIHSELPPSNKNVAEARESVEQPKEEITGKAGEKLVALLGEQPQPSPEIVALCEKIRRVIHDKRPPDEDSLVEAEPEAAAQAAGGEVKQSVDGEVKSVGTKYDNLQQTPEGQKEGEPIAVVAPENEVAAPEINAEDAVPDAVPAENISLDEDVASSDQEISNAGMTTEPASLVQDGPIAEARSAHDELKETAANDPAAVDAAQQATLAKAGESMNALQSKALQALMSSRTGTITGVGKQQGNMKETEQEKRKRVGAEAQQKFTNAQNAVTPLLGGLSKNAMEKWNAGVAIASTKFKTTLKKVQDWIDERHAGIVGTLVQIGDYFGGLPPWVTEVYNRAEKEFGDEVCTLITQISTEVNTVVASCEKIINDANDAITKLFKDNFGELDAWASAELGNFEAKIKGLHDQVADTKNQVNKDLAAKASESVQEVRVQINALRQKAKGLVGRIASAIEAFLDDPAKFIIEGLLSILGIPIPAFWKLVNKINTVIGQIADDPVGFGNNLMDALGRGFDQFINNFGSHLLEGLLDWLTSGLGAVGVQVPKDFSPKSMITFFLQLMGINWQRIRKLLAKHIGEENVAHLETAFGLIAELIEQGPEGIFEMIKAQLDPKTLLDQIFDAIVSFITGELVKRVAIEILKLFNPVGAILKAIEAIYAVFKWIFENAARIFTLVESIVNGISNIISGNIGAMATIVEKALTMLIAPIIDFFAELVGLGDLPNKVADLIKGFQGWIEGMMDKAIGWLAEKAKKLLKKEKKDERTEEQKKADLDKAIVEAEALQATPKITESKIKKGLLQIKKKYKMAALDLVVDSKTQAKEIIHVHGVINPEKDSSKTDVEQNAERPEVSVPFTLSGSSHELTFEPHDENVEVEMASEKRLPLTKKFQDAQVGINRFKHYMTTIKEPEVRKEYEAQFLPKIDNLQVLQVSEFTKIYKDLFPRSTADGPTISEDEAKRRVQRLISQADSLLNSLKTWGDNSGITDLSKEAIDETLRTKGDQIWRQIWQQTKQGINDTIKKLNYKGVPLQFTGSASSGWRGPHKGMTQFDVTDFDVDLYVVHAGDYNALLAKGVVPLFGKIFPSRETPDLRDLSKQVASALSTKFPGVSRISSSSIVLRKF